MELAPTAPEGSSSLGPLPFRPWRPLHAAGSQSVTAFNGLASRPLPAGSAGRRSPHAEPGSAPPPARLPPLLSPTSRGPRTQLPRNAPRRERRPESLRSPGSPRGKGAGTAPGARFGPCPTPHLPQNAAPSGTAGPGDRAEITCGDLAQRPQEAASGGAPWRRDQ